MMRSVLLHSDVLRGVMLQLISGELGVLFVLCPLSLYTSHFFVSLFSLSPIFHVLLNTNALEHRRPPHSSLRFLWLRATAAACSHLILSLSLCLSHTKNTHTQPLPPACIYLFVIFPNSVWRMSDSLTLHSARLIERHNIYVAETANYPTIYHPDYLSDWKLLVHVIGIIWN